MARKKYIRRRIVKLPSIHERFHAPKILDDINEILATEQKRYKYVRFGITTDLKTEYDLRKQRDDIQWSSMKVYFSTPHELEATYIHHHNKTKDNYIPTNIFNLEPSVFNANKEYYLYVMVGRRKKAKRKIKMIQVGTLFSGIGAIEQALIQMNQCHRAVFACDNGEIDLKLLPDELQKEFDVLRKIPRYRITEAERDRLAELTRLEQREIDIIANHVANLPTVAAKQEYVNELYRTHSKGRNYVKETYLANYQLGEHDFHLDVHFLDGRDYRGKVDLMVGGSPCQSFSSNGKRGGFADTRGTLFHEYARIIDEVQPKCFIFENVKGLLRHDDGATWATIRNTFEELNYDIYLNHDDRGREQPLLNAKDYGIPQNRERIFLVGIRNDIELNEPFVFPAPIELETINADYLEERVPAKYYLGQAGFEFVTTHPTRAQVGYQIQKCQKANQQFNWNYGA